VDAIGLLRTHFPGFEFRDVRIVEDGWDGLVLDVDGEWIVRFPRRPEVDQLDGAGDRPSARAGPTTLPVAIPRFELAARNGLVGVGYRKLAGSPARNGLGERTGQDLGRFLTVLHGFRAERARALGVPCFDPAG